MNLDSSVTSLRRLPLFALAMLAIAVSAMSPIRAGAAADPKTLAKCQATLSKAGAKFVGKKLAALGKCADGVFKCIQTVDETADAGVKRTACIVKARAGCGKALAAITAARAAFTGAASAACGALDPAQVTAADGLGYGDLDCSGFGVTVSNVATLGTCLAKQHDCLASEMFQLGVPRALELMQFTPPDAVVVPAADADALACLDGNGGIGADVNDLVLGKSLVKCQKAIEKVGTKLAGGRLKTLTKCVDSLFACAATKTGADLTKCRDKARAGCAKAFEKSGDKDTGLADSLAKPCGDTAVFAALLRPEGADFEALIPSGIVARDALGSCFPLATLADFQACLLAQDATQVADLVTFEAPRSTDLLADVNCDLDSCGPAPTPHPTGTPGPTSTPNNKPVAILGPNGDGQGHGISAPSDVAVDSHGVVYVTGCISDNVFKIVGTTVTRIMSSTGDGAGHGLDCASQLAIDGQDNVYVIGNFSKNVFKITPGGTVTLFLDATMPAVGGHTLDSPYDVVAAADGTVWVTGLANDNVFKIASNGTITEIITAAGDGGGAGHELNAPFGIALATSGDAAGTVYVTGGFSNNAFKITPDGTITRILSPAADGSHALDEPEAVAVDGLGNVFVAGRFSDNVFKITPDGTVSLALGIGEPIPLTVDANNNLYAGGIHSDVVRKRTPDGTVTTVSTDNFPAYIDEPTGLTTDAQGNLYVVGNDSGYVMKVPAP